MPESQMATSDPQKVNRFWFGYWPDETPQIDLAQARKALWDVLADLLPAPPCRVAVVARATDALLEDMAGRGYRIDSLSPQALLQRVVDPASLRPWDAVIVFECLQDFNPLGKSLSRLRERLVPDGRLVIAGEICQDAALGPVVNIPSYKEIVIALLEGGFRIRSSRAIGRHVFPTFAKMSAEQAPEGEVLSRSRSQWRLKHERHSSQQLGYQTFVAARDEVFLRPYLAGDETQILELFQLAFGTSRSLAHWRWKFEHNPFGSYRIAEAVSSDGALGAHFGGYPVPFHSTHGPCRDLITFQVGDTMTHPGFRASGRGATAVLSRIAIYFYNRFCLGRVPFIYGFNTGKIRRFGERFLEYEYIPEVCFHSLPVDDLDLNAFSRLAKSFNGFRVAPVSQTSSEFDHFFDEVCDDYGMLVKRSADYLRWRYLDCPDPRHHLYALRRFGRLVGWGAFSVRGNVLVWGDALFARRTVGSLRFFIAYLVKRVFSDVERIETWFSPQPAWWAEAVSAAGFEIGSEPNRMAPAFKIFDRTFSTAVFEKNLYYAMGDSDLF